MRLYVLTFSGNSFLLNLNPTNLQFLYNSSVSFPSFKPITSFMNGCGHGIGFEAVRSFTILFLTSLPLLFSLIYIRGRLYQNVIFILWALLIYIIDIFDFFDNYPWLFYKKGLRTKWSISNYFILFLSLLLFGWKRLALRSNCLLNFKLFYSRF